MEQPPTLSIVVCTYNRDNYIGKTLEHLLDQHIETIDYEVIIVNNNSTDHTDTICQDFISNHPQAPFHYFIEHNQGHSYSRNRGIAESKGNIISFIDDDAFVHHDFGTNIITYFNSHPEVKVIGGKIIPVYEDSAPNWMTPFLLPLVSALDMGSQPKPFTGRKFPVGANIAFRKSVFDRYGRFNVALGRKGTGLMGGDEKELVYRLKANNEPVHYVPNVVVDHIIPQKRLQLSYIRGLAQGVGQSEKERLAKASLTKKLSRGLEEAIKIGGTFVLFLWYGIKGQIAKGIMLIRFRVWVLQGFLD